MSISEEAKTAIRYLSRAQIQATMESNGYQVYEHESTTDLRQNVFDDVLNGVIDASEVFVDSRALPESRDR